MIPALREIDLQIETVRVFRFEPIKLAGHCLPYTSVSVQHVDGGVALVVQHLVEGEHVVVASVVRQVRVLDAAVGDGFHGLFELFGRQHFFTLLLLELVKSPRFALFQQIPQLDGLARSGLELLPKVSND